MSSELVKKICLGTAQFGLDYGVANSRGRITQEQARAILKYADAKGIDTLDTAFDYGQSEQLIGDFIGKNRSDFKIVSKLPALNRNNRKEITEVFRTTLSNLGITSIYGYLVHSFSAFLKYDELWEVLLELKQNRLIEKIGFSIYHPEELRILLDRKIELDLLQVPYSVFDRRFEAILPLAEEQGIAIYARSVFLQGLAFLDPENLPKPLLKSRGCLANLIRLSRQSSLPVNAICINFVMLNPSFDKLIFGVDGIGQLKENLAALEFIEQVEEIYSSLEELSLTDEEIILPYRWK